MRSITGSRLRLAVIGGTVLVIVIAVTLFMVLQARSQSVDLRGTFTLNDIDSAAANCVGQGGYADIASGTEVTVKDEHGTVLATSALTLTSAGESSCAYSFAMAAPRAEFYAVDVGGRRNVLHYSYEQLRLAQWTIAITLGEPIPPSTSAVTVTEPQAPEPEVKIDRPVLGGTWEAFVAKLGKPLSSDISGDSEHTTADFVQCSSGSDNSQYTLLAVGGPGAAPDAATANYNAVTDITRRLCSGRMTAQRAATEVRAFLPPDARTAKNDLDEPVFVSDELSRATAAESSSCPGDAPDGAFSYEVFDEGWRLTLGGCTGNP